MQNFIMPEIKVSVFEKTNVIVASGTMEEALAWMTDENGAGAVSESNVADFAFIYE